MSARTSTGGFTLLEVATSLTILAVLAAMLVPLAASMLDAERSGTAEGDLARVYTAIVGNPKQNNFGYLGDVGAYPASLLDLVQLPASNPAGWNGPYLSDARIENSILYDSFGGPFEYYQPAPVALSANPPNPTDQLVLISRGPDRSSTNPGGSNANVSANYSNVAPSSASYSAGAGNADNVVYPHVSDNQKLAEYQSVGRLNVNISNFDDATAVSALMPGCANYFDIVVVSVPRGTNEAYVNYAPGGASIDLVQGLYLLKVLVSGSTIPIWQEQVAIRPGDTTTKSLSLTGVNSTLGPTYTLNIVNASGAQFQVFQNGASLGTANSTAYPGTSTAFTMNRCSRIVVRNATTNAIVDSFISPSGPTGINRRYNSQSTCNITISNSLYNTVAIYNENVLLGTVGKRNNKRTKTFTVRIGDVLTYKDQGNASINSTSPSASSYTVACPASTIQFGT